MGCGVHNPRDFHQNYRDSGSGMGAVDQAKKLSTVAGRFLRAPTPCSYNANLPKGRGLTLHEKSWWDIEVSLPGQQPTCRFVA